MRIRIAGLIQIEDKILFVKHKKKDLEYFLLPGGGLEEGESFPQALIREFKEELSVDIEVGPLLFIGESFEPSGTLENKKESRHIIQVVFQVNKMLGQIKVNPDERLFDFDFLTLTQIENASIFPCFKNQLLSFLNKSSDFQIYEKYNWI